MIVTRQASRGGVGRRLHPTELGLGPSTEARRVRSGTYERQLDKYVKLSDSALVIRSDAELEEIRAKLQEQEARVVTYRRELERDGLPGPDIERALDPVRAFAQQLGESVEEYERVRRGELSVLASLDDLGPALVAARIAAGVTQRELAVLLGVHESQVSRDEKNDYHGVTLERASKLLSTIGVTFRGTLSIARSTAEGRGV